MDISGLITLTKGPHMDLFSCVFQGNTCSMQSWTGHMIINNYPPAHIGYEMVDSQQGSECRVHYNHLISNKGKWNNCFIKMPQKHSKLNF